MLILGPSPIWLHADPERTSALAGSVSSEQKEMIPAQIAAYRLAVQKGMIFPHLECATTANAEGMFQCEQLRAGLYVLVITIPPVGPADEHATPGKSTTPVSPESPAGLYASLAIHRHSSLPLFAYYPSLGGLHFSDLIHLAPGQTQTADIVIDSDTTSTLRAKPAQGFPTGQVALFVVGDDFSVPLNMQADVDASDGSYLWQGIPTGTYEIDENWGKQGVSHKAQRIVTVPEASTVETSLASDQFSQVQGTATGRSDKNSTASGLILDSVGGDVTRHYITSVEKSGAFTFSDVTQGYYRVAAAIGGDMVIIDVTVDGKSTNANILDVGEGISDQTLTVLEKRASGTVAGILKLDGSEPKPGIVIQSVESQSGLAVPVQRNGAFVISGLAPGRYRVYGWTDLSAVPYDSPAFLWRYVDHSVTVELDEGSTVTGVEVDCNKSDL